MKGLFVTLGKNLQFDEVYAAFSGFKLETNDCG
jgi:hypothetical protein